MRGIGEDEEVDPSRQAWLERIHPDDRARIIKEADRQNSGDLKQNAFEYRERHRDGHHMWILSRGRPYLAIANRQLELMHKFMSELGLSPASRSRVAASPRLGPKPWEWSPWVGGDDKSNADGPASTRTEGRYQ